jgi:predicted O-methyltransferase YrrM
LSSVLESFVLGVLRTVSPSWRARTDLFHQPYHSQRQWQSGLGEAARILHGVVRMTRPSVIVEIGSARGFSTCAMALGCSENRQGKVFAIDPHQMNEWTDLGTQGQTYEFLTSRLREYGLTQYCDVLRNTSREAAANWATPIDLLFIDGDHTLAGVREDYELFSPWMRSEGLIAFHDTTWEHDRPWQSYRKEEWFREDMGVGIFLDELQKRGLEGVTFQPNPGLTIMHPQPGGFEFLRRNVSSGTVSQSADVR